MELFDSQFEITKKDETALLDACYFIIISYVRLLFEYNCIVKSRYQDAVSKSMKTFNTAKKRVSRVALQKFFQHLYHKYLTDKKVQYSVNMISSSVCPLNELY